MCVVAELRFGWRKEGGVTHEVRLHSKVVFWEGLLFFKTVPCELFVSRILVSTDRSEMSWTSIKKASVKKKKRHCNLSILCKSQLAWIWLLNLYPVLSILGLSHLVYDQNTSSRRCTKVLLSDFMGQNFINVSMWWSPCCSSCSLLKYIWLIAWGWILKQFTVFVSVVLSSKCKP